jgi:hypothetical protein
LLQQVRLKHEHSLFWIGRAQSKKAWPEGHALNSHQKPK